MDDAISEVDLQAYVDDQLDACRRIEVEAYLQANPGAAARVMEDLRLRDEIRLFLTEAADTPADATVALTRQLARRVHLRSLALRLRRSFAAAVLVGVGWLAHAEFGFAVDAVVAAHPLPVFVEEAAEAHRTATAALAASVSFMQGDPALLARVAAVAGGDPVPLPDMGDDVEIIGSHLVPWDGGTAVQLFYRTPKGDHAALFAAEADGFDVTAPRAVTLDDLSLVHWQAGRYVYALSGSLPPRVLLVLAERATGGAPAD